MIIVAVIVIAIAAAMFLSRSCSSSQPSSITAGQSGNAATAASTATVTDPKSQIEVTDVKLDTDAIGRYYISAVATNKSTETYDVTLNASVIRHKLDDYGDDVAERKNVTSSTATPWVKTSGTDIILYGLVPGESKEFTIYPHAADVQLSKLDVSIESPEIAVTATSPTDLKKTQEVPDKESGLTVEMTVSDRILEGTVTNNTEKYIRGMVLYFVAYDTNGLPLCLRTAVGASPHRETGVLVMDTGTLSAKLKPGASADFSIYLTNDYTIREESTIVLRDAYYTIDATKE